MNRILKSPLARTHRQQIDLPAGAQIVPCQPQHGDVTLCIDQPRTPRTVTCVSSGQDLPDDAGQYLGTCQFHDGHTVVHTFIGGDHAQG